MYIERLKKFKEREMKRTSFFHDIYLTLKLVLDLSPIIAGMFAPEVTTRLIPHQI